MRGWACLKGGGCTNLHMEIKYALYFAAWLPALIINPQSIRAQGTAFSYQGRLNDGNNPANGSYDFAFTLYATNISGPVVAGPVTNSATAVSNGLFVATVDFGSAFPGGNNWLEIAARTNGAGSFVTLAPRQQVLPVPYALVAATASNVSGKIALSQLPLTVVTNGAGGVLFSGAFAGNGANLTNYSSGNLCGTIPPQALSGFANYAYAFNVITNYPDLGDGLQYVQAGGQSYLFKQVSDWTSPLNSATNYVAFGGGNWDLNDSGGYASITNFADNGSSQYLEWNETSTNVSFAIKGNSQFWQLLVDGVPEATQHYSETATNGGVPFLYTYTFPDRRVRHLELYGNCSFFGLAAGTNDGSGYDRIRTRSKKCVVVGDSFLGGPGVTAKYFAWRWENVDTVVSAEGGTGYISYPGQGSTNYLGRLIDITSVKPDFVVITGGINDPTNGLQASALAYYQAIQLNVPAAKIVVFGPWWPRTPLDPSILFRDAEISNACQQAGVPFISTLSPSPWIYGQQPNIGNAAVFIMPDNTHPTESGSQFLGNSMADAILNLYPDFDVPKATSGFVPPGAVTTNITGFFNGGTHTACFTNGILMNFQ
jgi:lysophospholipase L1-like esterase